MSQRPEIFRRAVLAAASVVAALGLLACGSSSGTSGASSPAARASHDTVTTGTKVHKPFPGTGAGEVNDDNPAAASGSGTGGAVAASTGAKQGSAEKQKEPVTTGSAASFNPCRLVTRGEAESILGHAIAKPALAPLGPSCIYRVRGAKTTVTVAVQATSFRTLKSHLKKTQHKTVAGHSAYCGVYGQSTTIVALTHGRVLTIAAGCPVGFRFAAKALTRL